MALWVITETKGVQMSPIVHMTVQLPTHTTSQWPKSGEATWTTSNTMNSMLDVLQVNQHTNISW